MGRLWDEPPKYCVRETAKGLLSGKAVRWGGNDKQPVSQETLRNQIKSLLSTWSSRFRRDSVYQI